jgi:hypothetical protein
MNHFISITDASDAELLHVFDVAYRLRSEGEVGKPNEPILRS